MKIKSLGGGIGIRSRLRACARTGVIANSFDRMYRNVHQFLNFLNRLEQSDEKLITVKEGLDTTSTLGRAIVTILMVIYQFESEQISNRMTANVKYKREELGRHWGPTPFGCDRDKDGQLIPATKSYWFNPLTGEAYAEGETQKDGWEHRQFYDGLVEIYCTYANGQYSYGDTADIVNAAGWRYYADRKAKPRLFNADAIRRIVSNWQLFLGELPLGNVTNTSNPAILPGGHDPILTVELCNEVGVVKAERGRGSGNPSPGHARRLYLLSNVLFCAVCSKPLKGQFQEGRRIYRHYGGKKGCPEKWAEADDIEAKVIELLVGLTDSELLAAVTAKAGRLAREAFAQVDSNRTLLTELEHQKKRLTRLEDLYLDADIARTATYTKNRTKTELFLADKPNVISTRYEDAKRFLHQKSSLLVLDEALNVQDFSLILRSK